MSPISTPSFLALQARETSSSISKILEVPSRLSFKNNLGLPILVSNLDQGPFGTLELICFRNLGMQGIMSSGPWTSLCSARVLELAAPGQRREQGAGALCALGAVVETPGPGSSYRRETPHVEGGQPTRRPSTHKESREAEKTSPPFRGTRRSWLSAASPSARPGAATRPPRGLCGSCPCTAPGGFPGAPRRCMRGNGSRRSRLGGGALSRRGL